MEDWCKWKISSLHCCDLESFVNHSLTLLSEMKWSEVAQWCPTLCNPVDCSPPESSVHGILQARILEWVAISFSRLIMNPPPNAGDARNTGSIPELGRSPGVGNGNPLQYSCLENPMDRAGWATVHEVTKSRTRLSTCTHKLTGTNTSQFAFLALFPITLQNVFHTMLAKLGDWLFLIHKLFQFYAPFVIFYNNSITVCYLLPTNYISQSLTSTFNVHLKSHFLCEAFPFCLMGFLSILHKLLL